MTMNILFAIFTAVYIFAFVSLFWKQLRIAGQKDAGTSPPASGRQTLEEPIILETLPFVETAGKSDAARSTPSTVRESSQEPIILEKLPFK